jgi:D-inositol-3-phosphate glycosyltransferase
VVAARVGGLPSAVGEAGVLVDGHDIPVWADALEGLLTDPERRRSLSRKAVDHAALFGWDRTAERLYEVYVEAKRARARSQETPQPQGALEGVPAAVVP